MRKSIEYEVRYDIVSEISYIGEENPGEHHFRIHRHWAELTFDDEEGQARAIVTEEGTWNIEDYDGSYLREEEEEAINEMMKKILEA